MFELMAYHFKEKVSVSHLHAAADRQREGKLGVKLHSCGVATMCSKAAVWPGSSQSVLN